MKSSLHAKIMSLRPGEHYYTAHFITKVKGLLDRRLVWFWWRLQCTHAQLNTMAYLQVCWYFYQASWPTRCLTAQKRFFGGGLTLSQLQSFSSACEHRKEKEA